MKTLRLLPLPLLLVLGLLLAGCGGGSTYKARKTAFPKVGTAQYKSLQDQAVTYLVQESELEQRAKALGVSVTTKDVTDRINAIKQQYFSGSETKYKAQLKAQGLTEAQLRQDLYAQILSEKLYAKVTADVKVSDAQVSAYYKSHKSTYVTPKTREVAHILVNSKSLANQLETKLKNGANFATLAKKYSKDTGSAKQGGKLCVAHGQSTSDGSCQATVAPFDKAAFSLKTGEISAPVHSTYGWHIIKALADVKPSHTTPFKSVSTQIRQTLLSTQKTKKMTAWVNQMKKDFASKVSYQTGYEPAATTSSTTATTATTG